MDTKKENKQVTTAIWERTRNDLRLLAALKTKSMVATIQEITSDALDVAQGKSKMIKVDGGCGNCPKYQYCMNAIDDSIDFPEDCEL